MSRSYKHFPLFRDVLNSTSMKYGKRQANKRVRRYLKNGMDIPNGSKYKQIYDNWDIYEYKHYQTKEDAIREWEEDQFDIANGIKTWKSNLNYSKEEAILYWFLSYKRK